MPYGWMFIGALVACAFSLLVIDHDPPGPNYSHLTMAPKRAP
jgi:hypothetical protein